MNFLKYSVLTILGITYLIILILSIKSKKPLKFLFTNAIVGIFCLFVINFTKRYSGVFIPINEYTIIAASTLGVPSIIGFLALNFILM